jgi:hypothetical protein
MKGTSVAAFGLFIVSVVPLSLFAKGRTIKITIHGSGLTSPLEITDPELEQFGIWAGPGVFRNGIEESEGFIINWSKGIVAELPTGLQDYEVEFYSGCRMTEFGCRSSKPSLAYVVSYDYDPSTQEGFVYLPDDQAFRSNRMWYAHGRILHGHGFEGNWLYATSAWENFVRPLIAKARDAAPRH